MLSVVGLLIVCASVVFSLKSEADCHLIFCPALVKPVCGSNGKTYGNKCELGRATCKDKTIQMAHNGICKKGNLNCVTEIACIARYDPVCGTDGETYSNGCYLAVAMCRKPALSMAYRGRCKKQKLP